MGRAAKSAAWLFETGLARDSWRGPTAGVKRRILLVIGLAFVPGCLLFLGLIVLRHEFLHRRAGMPVAALPRPQSPFEASFARAQDWYFRAEVITKRQLESLEEWDPDGIRGSVAEVYHRNIIACTREMGQAEVAAREAAGRAQTNEDACRATRLLVHIERELGHRRAELELAKKLVARQPRNPGALLWLARAAEDNGQTSLARQAELKSGMPLGACPGEPQPRP